MFVQKRVSGQRMIDHLTKDPRAETWMDNKYKTRKKGPSKVSTASIVQQQDFEVQTSQPRLAVDKAFGNREKNFQGYEHVKSFTDR
ncbi:hypothetical protein ACP70R_011926 [Stipagrostis hirtigluma subsp. patula]